MPPLARYRCQQADWHRSRRPGNWPLQRDRAWPAATSQPGRRGSPSRTAA